MNWSVRGDSVDSLERFALFEFLDFAQLCADGPLANIEMLPAQFGSFDGEGRGARFAGECQIIRFGGRCSAQYGAIAEFKCA